MIKSLSKISWKQVENMIRDKEFLKNIEKVSEDELKESFKKFNVEPTNLELREFKRLFIKVLNDAEEIKNPNYISKKLLSDDELSEASGGSVSSHILVFIAGVVATCAVCGITAKSFLDSAKNKYNELQNQYDNYKKEHPFTSK